MKTGMMLKTNLLSVLALVGVLSATAACSKKDDGNQIIVGAQPLACQGSICANVGTAPGVLISASTTAMVYGAQVDMALDVIADATRFNINDPKAVIMYSGPAAISGYLRVAGTSGNFGTSLCGAFPGDYYMQATQQGSMTQATLTGGRIASGTGPNGGRIEATIIQGILNNSQDPNGTSKGSATNRMYLTMRIDSVNGQPCGVSFQGN